MRRLKENVLEEMGKDQWTVTRTGMFRCPHGNLIEDDLLSGHGDCGCSTPIPI